MEMTTFGRTGLAVSVVGLGCGGHSRLGMARGESEVHAAGIVSHALDRGVNYIDTANAYGTEAAVGRAIAGRRDDVILSSKTAIRNREGRLSEADIVANLDNSLKQLGTGMIDVYNLHGLTVADLDWAVSDVLPLLAKQQASGKFRFLGVTERFGSDTSHRMLEQALVADCFDVVMVGFNLLNPSARRNVFPQTQRRNVATQVMFAVRRSLVDNARAADVIATLVEKGEVAGAAGDLGFLTGHPDIASLTEAAYRFCRHEPGVDVVLTGTGSADHLDENIAAILAPKLPVELSDELARLFGEVCSVTGD